MESAGAPVSLALLDERKQDACVSVFRQRADTRLLAAGLVLAVATLSSCFFDDAPSESGDPGVEHQGAVMLDFDGIDGLAIGGTTADAEHGGLSLVQDGDRFDSCVVMAVQSLPGVTAIVVNDTIAVIELAGENKTIAGVGRGSTKTEVTSAHPGQRLQERVNRFAFAEVAVAQSAEDDPLTLSYIFDHAAESVTHVRAGRASNLLAHDEGCA